MFIRILAILGACLALSACAVQTRPGEVTYYGINEAKGQGVVNQYDHNWAFAEANPTIVISPRELGRGGLVGSPVPWLVCYQHWTTGATLHLCLNRDQWEHPRKPTHYVFHLNTRRSRTLDIPRYFEQYSGRIQYGRGTEGTHISGGCTITLNRKHCVSRTTTVETVTEDRFRRSNYHDGHHDGNFRRQRVSDDYCGGYLGKPRRNCSRY